MIKLRDVIHVRGTGGGKEMELPRLAAKYWEEYSEKQTLLSTFFGKGSASASRDGGKAVVPSSTASSLAVAGRDAEVTMEGTQAGVIDSELDATVVGWLDVSRPSELPALLSLPSNPARELELNRDSSQPRISLNPGPPPLSLPPTATATAPTPTPHHTSSQTTIAPSLSRYPHKPRENENNPTKHPPLPLSPSKTKRKQISGQTKLSTFFAQPSASDSTSVVGGSKNEIIDQGQDQVEVDYRLALELPASQETLLSQALPVSASSALAPNGKQTTSAWSHLLG